MSLVPLEGKWSSWLVESDAESAFGFADYSLGALLGLTPMDVDDAVLRRCSQRVFDQSSDISTATLSAITGGMAKADSQMRSTMSTGSSGLRLRVYCNRVAGLARGWTEYADSQFLPLPGTGDLTSSILTPDINPRFEPDVAISIAGDLRAAVREFGSDGYRLELISAGAAALAGWALCVARGYACGLFASVRHEEASILTAGDGLAARHLLTLAIGQPQVETNGAAER
jgi:hypothetical protein